ncbi:PX domain-containing protein [Plectosphaerella cucumerina]|jgi:regulator of vacuolar morphogenesis|uniref:PX domain-containing protein n=1 Tax=Plectosphaerella cucumerina TaxID=40658 RepID=A0A8K0TM86_9PEZI|nr:PX domain-containing protein [Plectosphaerella cucumerina]
MAPPAEILIPSTIVSSGESKPYTLYNLTLRLPLRSYVVQKRYSDFLTLNDAMTSQAGAPPPVQLPGKSWFKSTVHNADLTEARRKGLETYMRTLAESPDRRWRDTPAWRAFLNLPSGGSTSNSAASATGMLPPGAAAAAVGADPTSWLDLHREMKASLHEARLALSRRDAAAESSNPTAAAEAGAAAKRSLVKAAGMITTLSDGLRRMQEAGRLGDGELRRRRDLVSSARVERDGLERLSTSLSPAMQQLQGGGGGPGGGREGWASSSDKAALLGTGAPRAGGRVLGAPLPETERTRELGNESVVQLQKQMMSEQDEQVEALAAIVRRQKEMGLRINDEIEAQTEMLDRINDDADRVGGKMRVAKNRIKKL